MQFVRKFHLIFKKISYESQVSKNEATSGLPVDRSWITSGSLVSYKLVDYKWVTSQLQVSNSKATKVHKWVLWLKIGEYWLIPLVT